MLTVALPLFLAIFISGCGSDKIALVAPNGKVYPGIELKDNAPEVCQSFHVYLDAAVRNSVSIQEGVTQLANQNSQVITWGENHGDIYDMAAQAGFARAWDQLLPNAQLECGFFEFPSDIGKYVAPSDDGFTSYLTDIFVNFALMSDAAKPLTLQELSKLREKPEIKSLIDTTINSLPIKGRSVLIGGFMSKPGSARFFDIPIGTNPDIVNPDKAQADGLMILRNQHMAATVSKVLREKTCNRALTINGNYHTGYEFNKNGGNISVPNELNRLGLTTARIGVVSDYLAAKGTFGELKTYLDSCDLGASVAGIRGKLRMVRGGAVGLGKYGGNPFFVHDPAHVGQIATFTDKDWIVLSFP